ncbi:MAG: ring-cleaving dioxygenase [Pyrinomonadaceae bacterium]
MKEEIPGIHHVTAIAGDPQQNLNFYAGTLGLRLVKRTINFDDPSTYHFYYGDEAGTPGTILTFFPWPGVRRGRAGTGQATSVAFSIPESSLGFWIERLTKHNVEYEKPARRFDEGVLAFRDKDGLMLELITDKSSAERRRGWERGSVPPKHAIRGIHSVTMCVDGYEHTAKLLTETMGFRQTGEEESVFRFAAGEGGAGAQVNVRCAPDFWPGVVAGGSVHHVAWRARDDAAQRAWSEQIAATGLNVTPVLDRQYFRSIYFREPGGVLFEIATDPPGFTIDEPLEQLGAELKLPSWLEPNRKEIESILPQLDPPQNELEQES